MKTVGPRSLAGALKVFLYIAFGIGVLYFAYRTWAFATIVRHADDLGPYVSTTIRQLPVEQLQQKEWRSENGRMRLTLHCLYGELRHRNMSRPLVAFLWVEDIALFFLFFVAIIQLANLFEDLSAGRVFEPGSARRLRLIGLAAIAASVLGPVFEILPLWIFPGEILIPGAPIPWLLFFWTKLNLGLLLGGLLLLVVAEAFRIGHRLDEEQKLTV